jgi:hypothetical protein
MEKRFEGKLYNLMNYILQAVQLFTCLFNNGSRESVVFMWTGSRESIVFMWTGMDRTGRFVVQTPEMVRFSANIQSELEANTASCTLAIGSFSWSQFSRSVLLKSYPHQARGLRMGTAVIPICTRYASNSRLGGYVYLFLYLTMIQVSSGKTWKKEII